LAAFRSAAAFLVALASSSVTPVNSSKLATRNPTAVIAAPIPVANNAALNV
jgi:hypothetical protein